MNALRLRTAVALALGALVALTGCSKSLKHVLMANQSPVVRLTSAPVDANSAYFYAYKINWIGYDPDGRVDHFEYAIDPPSNGDTVWVSTVKNEQIFFFRSTSPESIPDQDHQTRTALGQDYHTFVIRAVDDEGAVSPRMHRSFLSYTVAPTVEILSPIPSRLIQPVVTPAVIIRWTGTDPDGQFTQKPVKYKYKLFKEGPDYPFQQWKQFPDSMRTYWAPTFTGWDSTSADTTEVQFTNLTPNSLYLFVVVAFDEAGAYSPVFSMFSNMLEMSVGFAGTLGPQITMFNEFFAYTYPSGGFSVDPSKEVQLQIPSDRTITINWFADPPPGSQMRRYRWRLMDPPNFDLEDETPRTDERTDWYHWSQWSLNTTSATIGPFAGSANPESLEVHKFFVEAEDLNGLVSLGIIRFVVVRPTFNRDLLIVDDMRLKPDQLVYPPPRTPPPGVAPDTVFAPLGLWPDGAEVDTFLYAHGNVRWRFTPWPMQSQPGVFMGYRYDTLTTRNLLENPTTPLTLLGQYRHIIWLTDAWGSQNWPGVQGGGSTAPQAEFTMSTLRYMSSPNHQNTLAAWVSQGGELWGMGGGFANATNASWNNTQNDGPVRLYSNLSTRPDLVPGRFMYDLAHWRSEVRELTQAVNVKVARYDQPDPTSYQDPANPSWWRGGSLPRPEYAALPTFLRPKSPDTDPVSYYPNRATSDVYINQPGSQKGVDLEWISQENVITEIVQTGPGTEAEFSTLDTLFMAYCGLNAFNHSDDGSGVNPIMTVYRGSDTPRPVIFLGTSPWHFARPDFVQLVDYVLHDRWGMSRTSTAGPGTPTPRAGVIRYPSPVAVRRQ